MDKRTLVDWDHYDRITVYSLQSQLFQGSSVFRKKKVWSVRCCRLGAKPLRSFYTHLVLRIESGHCIIPSLSKPISVARNVTTVTFPSEQRDNVVCGWSMKVKTNVICNDYVTLRPLLADYFRNVKSQRSLKDLTVHQIRQPAVRKHGPRGIDIAFCTPHDINFSRRACQRIVLFVISHRVSHFASCNLQLAYRWL